MLALRFIGALFLLGAVIALTSDLSQPHPAGQSVHYASLLHHWADFAPQTLSATRKTVATKLHPLVWDPLIAKPLELPAWVSLAGLAVLCFYLGRPRRRIEVFVN